MTKFNIRNGSVFSTKHVAAHSCNTRYSNAHGTKHKSVHSIQYMKRSAHNTKHVQYNTYNNKSNTAPKDWAPLLSHIVNCVVGHVWALLLCSEGTGAP